MTDGVDKESKPQQIPVVEVDPTVVDPSQIADSQLDFRQQGDRIYTRAVTGLFSRIREYMAWPLLLGFFLLPWLNWDDRQAVLFDLPARKFYIFGITFWPQDFPLLAWGLIIAALALLAVTVFAGRVWCGYTCPQTVWTQIFMWVERFTEGSRNQRIKLDKRAFSADKVARKTAKHGLWLLVSLATGLAFIGYFSPVRSLVPEIFSAQSSLMEYAWVVFFTLATYINAGWMREYVCLHVCPYARFQSVMFDSDTLIVSYDEDRGEPRGARKHGVAPAEVGLGDCIGCQLCVQVCPTGIDIRNGLQYECIACALCIDACDGVMDEMGYEPGLIRYTTENSLAGKPTHILRPRLLVYGAALLLMGGFMLYSLLGRVPLGIDVIRERGQLYHQVAPGVIENVYTLKIRNMTQQDGRYRISAEADFVELIGDSEVSLSAGEVLSLPVRLRANLAEVPATSAPVNFIVIEQVTDESEATTAAAESRFMSPSKP